MGVACSHNNDGALSVIRVKANFLDNRDYFIPTQKQNREAKGTVRNQGVASLLSLPHSIDLFFKLTVLSYALMMIQKHTLHFLTAAAAVLWGISMLVNNR